jgi:hypothetical protein
MTVSPVWAPLIGVVFLCSRRAIKYWCAVLTLKIFGHSIKR